MARCFSKITKTQWFSPSYIMSRTYQHDLRHWTPNTMNTCEFSITWRLHTKIEFTHQILCIKIKIPTLKEKIPHAEKLSRAEFGTFSSLLSVKKNCVTVNFPRISILNRTFWSEKRIVKITKLCRKQCATWRFEKITKTVPFGQFSCWKTKLSASSDSHLS